MKKKKERCGKVFIKDTVIKPDAFALWLLEMTIPNWLPERLRSQIKDSLRGYNEGMALEIADDLVDCWTYGVRHYTGIAHIDRQLKSLYNKIMYAAEQKNIILPMHF